MNWRKRKSIEGRLAKGGVHVKFARKPNVVVDGWDVTVHPIGLASWVDDTRNVVLTGRTMMKTKSRREIARAISKAAVSGAEFC